MSDELDGVAIRERLQALVGELKNIKGNLLTPSTTDSQVQLQSKFDLTGGNGHGQGSAADTETDTHTISADLSARTAALLRTATGQDEEEQGASNGTGDDNAADHLGRSQQTQERIKRALRYNQMREVQLAKLQADEFDQQNSHMSPSGTSTSTNRLSPNGIVPQDSHGHRSAAGSPTASDPNLVSELQQDIQRLRKKSRALAKKMLVRRTAHQEAVESLQRCQSKFDDCLNVQRVRAMRVRLVCLVSSGSVLAVARVNPSQSYGWIVL